MGAYDVQEVQIYKEASYGVTGVPTARLMLLEDATFNPKTPAKVFRQLHGSLGVGGLGARIFTGGEGNLKGVLSYDDLGYYFENLFGIVAPSAFPVAPAAIAIASSTNVNPTVITTAVAHGLVTGNQISILGHLVNTAANGTWIVTVLSTTTFSIPVAGNGVGAATGTINAVALVSSTNANPTVITTAVHSLATGDQVTIQGHLTNTAANGTWPITVLSATTFSIPVAGNGVGGATGSAIIAPYKRSGQAPLLVSSLNPRFMSLMKGDADGVYNMVGAMIQELTLTCEQNETKSELMFDAKLICKNIVTGATLATLSDRLVLPITASDFAIYLDPASGAPGATVMPTTAFGFEVKLSANRKEKQHLGNIGIDAIDQLAWEPDKQTVKLNMEYNATSKVFVDALQTAAPWQKNLRLRAANGANLFQLDLGVQGTDTPVLYANKGSIKAVDVQCTALETSGLGNWLAYKTASNVAVLL
jgi:hypothetical protein